MNGFAACRAALLGAGILSLLAVSIGTAGAETLKLRVMTFNLRYASDQPPNAWPDRRPVMKKTILDADPDIIGTQEGLYAQLKNIAEDISAYAWIGEGREGGSAGEFMAIFYKRERLEPMAYGHIWLSDTPRVVASKTWGNTLPRMATWVRFKEKPSGAEFIHWNTHFDHQSQPARERSAELLIKEIRGRNPGLPVIVTGDFNQDQTNIVHQTLVAAQEGAASLRDQWELAASAERIEGKQVGTWNGFLGENAETRRIDWILATPDFNCTKAQVITRQENGQWPSDHFPVLATLEMKSAAAE